MTFSTRFRTLGALGLTAALSLGASACGDGSAVAGPRPTEIPPTNFAIIPNTNVTTPPGDVSGADALALRYVVKAGDSLAAIGRTHKVTPQSIANVNNWDDGVKHNLIAGQTILLPKNAVLPVGVAAGQKGGPEAETTTTTTAPKCYKDYTIVKGDTKKKVANKLGITVAELDAANVDVRAYKRFVVGGVIKYPAKKCPKQ